MIIMRFHSRTRYLRLARHERSNMTGGGWGHSEPLIGKFWGGDGTMYEK